MSAAEDRPCRADSPGDDPAGAVSRPAQIGRAAVVADRVRVIGEIDMSNSDLLRAALDKVLRRTGSGFVVDLTEVTYLDSSALSVLWHYVDKRPRILVREGSLAARVINLSGLDKVTHIETPP
jgi:anti-anti-sigma factor